MLILFILLPSLPDSGNLRHDRLPEWIVAIPPWHIDAVGGRLHHQRPADALWRQRRVSCLMVTIHRAHGLRIIIFTDDHEPAHVHAFGDGQAKINLIGPSGAQSLSGPKA